MGESGSHRDSGSFAARVTGYPAYRTLRRWGAIVAIIVGLGTIASGAWHAVRAAFSLATSATTLAETVQSFRPTISAFSARVDTLSARLDTLATEQHQIERRDSAQFAALRQATSAVRQAASAVREATP